MDTNYWASALRNYENEMIWMSFMCIWWICIMVVRWWWNSPQLSLDTYMQFWMKREVRRSPMAVCAQVNSKNIYFALVEYPQTNMHRVQAQLAQLRARREARSRSAEYNLEISPRDFQFRLNPLGYISNQLRTKFPHHTVSRSSVCNTYYCHSPTQRGSSEPNPETCVSLPFQL